jgi:hypothetical protein
MVIGSPTWPKQWSKRVAECPSEQVKDLALALLARALAGDVNAAKVVLAYAVGRPLATVDPDGADLNEWELRQAWPHIADVWAEASSLRS